MMVRMKSKIKISGKDAFGWLLICISVLMLCKSLALCFSNDIWYDELFTVGMIEHSYGELIHFTAADVHPPLYYCVTKFFVDLCKLVLPGAGTVIPAKIVSVLPYFVLLLYSVRWIRKRFSLKALVTTQKLERLMAAAPNMGFNFQPKTGYHNPAARGIPTTL